MTQFKLGKKKVMLGYYINNVYCAKPRPGLRYNLESLTLDRNEEGDLKLFFDKIRTYKIKEVHELYDGLYVVLTTRHFHICFNALKDGDKYKFAIIEDKPSIDKELKLRTVYQKNAYSISLGWELSNIVPEEVDLSFEKRGVYIVKANGIVYLCTTK